MTNDKIANLGQRRIQRDQTDAQVKTKPSLIVREVLRKENLLQEMNKLCQEWPALAHISRNMGAYLTDQIPDIASSNDRCLLGKCLKSAVAAWNAEKHASGNTIDCYTAFVRGVLAHTSELSEWAIYIEEDGSRILWNPLDGPLLTWWNKQGGIIKKARRERPWDISFSHISECDIRHTLLVRLLRGRDIDLLSQPHDALVGRAIEKKTYPC